MNETQLTDRLSDAFLNWLSCLDDESCSKLSDEDENGIIESAWTIIADDYDMFGARDLDLDMIIAKVGQMYLDEKGE